MGKTIFIEDDTTGGLMRKLALELGTDLIEKDYEYICSFPQEMGSGYIKVSSFPNDITVTEISGIFSRELILGLKKKDDYSIKMTFNLSNPIGYRVSSEDTLEMHRFDSTFHAAAQGESGYPSYLLDKNTPISLFILNIHGNEFLKKLEENSSNGELGITVFIKPTGSKKSLVSKSSFTLKLHELIKNFISNDYAGPMRFIYKEARVNEILIERIRQYIDDLGRNKIPLLRKSTLRAIEEATRIIAENLDTKKTIKDIASEVGLSQHTLQSGFQHQFGCSVNEFITNLKLKKGAELLERSDLNISEITYELGINSKSYFAKRFYERYGINPSEYRKLFRAGSGTMELSQTNGDK